MRANDWFDTNAVCRFVRARFMGCATWLRHLAEAALFLLVIAMFRVVGLDFASVLGGAIGRHILYRAEPLMKRARNNLMDAFPEKTGDEIEKILVAMCDNLGRTIAEYAHFDKFSLDDSNPRLEIVNHHIAKQLLSQSQGIIFFSGHLANWELMPFVAMQLGFQGGEVYRPQNNPFVDSWLVKQRSRYGTSDQIAKGPSGTRRVFSLLRGGKAVYLLADQKTNEGISVPFFGRDAMTTPAPALLALKTSATLLPASIERMVGSRFRITLHTPIEFTPSGDDDRDVFKLTCMINDSIEKWVRERPDQWLWIHRRWPTDRQQDRVRSRRALRSAETSA